MHYRQCDLRRGNTVTTSWIPERYARRGRYIRLKDEDGWLVESVGMRATEQQVLERERDHLYQRKASDI